MKVNKVVTNFNKASDKLRIAERALGKWTAAQMKKCKTVEDYYSLIDQLPNEFDGTRRIYEAIIRLELAE